MSYAGFGLTQGCPDGFVMNAAGNCVSSSADQCPTGFVQKVPGECWPASETASASVPRPTSKMLVPGSPCHAINVSGTSGRINLDDYTVLDLCII